MKNYSCLLLLLVFPFYLSAQIVLPFFDSQKGLYGYANEDLEIKIPIKYTTVSLFNKEGFAEVTTEDEKILIDRTGNELLAIPQSSAFALAYQAVSNYNSRYFCIYKKDKLTEAPLKDSLCYVYDKKKAIIYSGKYKLKDAEYPKSVESRFMMLKTENNRFSVVDTAGVFLIKDKENVRYIYPSEWTFLDDDGKEKRINIFSRKAAEHKYIRYKPDLTKQLFFIKEQDTNLFTLTEYRGYDPTTSSGAPIGGGIDLGFYPSAKTFILGANLKF